MQDMKKLYAYTVIYIFLPYIQQARSETGADTASLSKALLPFFNTAHTEERIRAVNAVIIAFSTACDGYINDRIAFEEFQTTIDKLRTSFDFYEAAQYDLDILLKSSQNKFRKDYNKRYCKNSDLMPAIKQMDNSNSSVINMFLTIFAMDDCEIALAMRAIETWEKYTS